ncbi:MAG: hypothetical protein GY847_13995 [Proteobacteria bacterium]|nr:hypothetical protein [Pseudomonadota bacterium]
MPVFGLRDFECTLCQQSFTMPSGDLILPEPNICDECIVHVWDMGDQALTEHVIKCLPDKDNVWVNEVIQYIKKHKESGGEVKEILKFREQQRKLFG